MRLKVALDLIVDLIGCRDVLRIHLGHHELAQHLNLLHLRECDFVADLKRLKIAYRRLIPKLKRLQRSLLYLEVLGLSLCEASAPLRVSSVVSMVVCGL